MAKQIAYNMDCMEYLRTLPDNAFDLAVVDPPYGGGFTEGGGCKGWFTKYHQDTCSKSVNEETGKKSSLGTWLLEKIILMSFSAFPSIRSFGAGTTSNCRRRGAFLYGESSISRWKVLVWRQSNTPGLPSLIMPGCLRNIPTGTRTTSDSTRHRNPSHSMRGYIGPLRNRA